MQQNKTYRINGFEQIKAFYSWVFNNADKRITPQHISLYIFLINQCNRNNWVEWFKVPYDLAMAGACIGNKKTYYSCLADLSKLSLISYKKGINEWKAPLIRLEVLKCTSTNTATVPLPEPLLDTQVVPLPIPLPTHIYKLLTYNLKRITNNIEKVVDFLNELENIDKEEEDKRRRRMPFMAPTIEEVRKYFEENGYDPDFGETRWHYYNDANWHDSKGSPVLNWKQKMRAVWFKPDNKIKKQAMVF